MFGPRTLFGLGSDELDVSRDGVSDWRMYALCAQTDPESFFPEKGEPARDGKRMCQRCDVRDECLEYALANEDTEGVWGGLSERERRALRRQRRA